MMTEIEKDYQDKVFEAIHYHFLKIDHELTYDYKDSIKNLKESIDDLIDDLKKIRNKLWLNPLVFNP